MLPINEIFDTIQGEAYWTGTPSTFVRLQGCPVGCPWCDTKHTWHVFPDTETSPALMLDKLRDSPAYALTTVDQIVAECRQRHVVLTGGEPCMYDLVELTTALGKAGKKVQVETSGTFEIHVDEFTWVTLSPKIDMPGGYVVLASAAERANEIKMPVGKRADVEKLQSFLLDYEVDKRPVLLKPVIWLQPLSQSPKATELCIAAASEHGWRLSLQTHKFLGVR